MKVNIGPYRRWIGPYQIAEKICFWWDKEDDRVFAFGHWLAENKDGTDSRLTRLCQWFETKRDRKVQVRIDKYDTWSMDATLAYIILPMLKQLKETKHGSPSVDDKDVPKELRSTSAPARENEWDIDDNHHKRWEWVMDQMIWSFEQIHPDNDSEAQFHKKGEFDIEGFKKHDERLQKGLTLFGKYFRGLWD